MPTAIVIAASSDIGTALCHHWLTRGWTVAGTYRTDNEAISGVVRSHGSKLPAMIRCDLTSPSVMDVCAQLRGLSPPWDVLAVCAGQLTPLQPFLGCPSSSWEDNLRVNLLGPARVLRYLLPHRNTAGGKTPTVILFAGAGTNSAPARYSAYAVAKVGLIKLCELLDAEIQDTKFTILGPGWVKTKLHNQTLEAGDRAGEGYARTHEMFQGGRWTPMERVLDCVEWVVGAPREAVGGRNFSVAHDLWGHGLEAVAAAQPDLYKLRRNPC